MKKLWGWGLIMVLLFSGCATKTQPTPEPVVPVEEPEPEPPPPPPLDPADEIALLIREGRVAEAQSRFLAFDTPDAVDSDGRSFLHMAADAANLHLADFFYRQSVPYDTKDNEGRTPLGIATDLMNVDLASFFVRQGASIHNLTVQGNTTATKAIAQNNKAFLEAIITRESLTQTDSAGRTIIHLATEEGIVSAVDTIIERAGYDYIPQVINRRDRMGRTALDIAYSHRESEAHAEAARSLIMGSALSSDPFNSYFSPAIKSLNYNLRSSNGASPLHYAVQEGYTGYITYLLRMNADPNIKNAAGETPLHTAMARGDVAVIRQLVNAGANVSAQDGRGNSPMHIAVPSEHHAAALAVLFAHGANPNLRDELGNTPLMLFVRLNREPIVVETLLRGGSNVGVQNSEGKTALYLAVEEKRVAFIALLLSFGSDIFSITGAGQTPFGKALSDNSPALDALITENTVRAQDAVGNTPLIVAMTAKAPLEVIRKILERGAFVNARNKEGEGALHIAVRNNAADVGTFLLENGADIFAENVRGETPLLLTFFSKAGTPRPAREIRSFMLVPSVMSARDGVGNTVLHYATQWKMDGVIPSIVQRGANTEAANVSGETPLFLAVKANSPSTIKALLSAGASLTGRDTLSNTALHTAVRSNATQAAEALIDAKINIDAYNLYGQTPLHDAVRLNSFEAQSLLVTRGADLEVRDNGGNTPLLLAVSAGVYRSADHLLGANADSNTRNNNGDTALHIAVRDERSDLVGLLLKAGASIHSQNADGESPFTIALSFSDTRNQAGASRMVSTLLTTDRVKTSDDEGRSPLHIAIMRSMSLSKLEVILSQGGKINAVDREGRTPLRFAADMNNWEAVRFLVGAGSDVFSTARDGRSPAEVALSRGDQAVRSMFSGRSISARDSSGNTILHYAARNGSRDLVNLLLELGADRTARNTSGETPGEIAERWGNTAALTLLR